MSLVNMTTMGLVNMATMVWVWLNGLDEFDYNGLVKGYGFDYYDYDDLDDVAYFV